MSDRRPQPFPATPRRVRQRRVAHRPWLRSRGYKSPRVATASRKGQRRDRCVVIGWNVGKEWFVGQGGGAGRGPPGWRAGDGQQPARPPSPGGVVVPLLQVLRGRSRPKPGSG